MLIKQNTTPTITIQCTIDFINSGQLPASYQICKTGGTLVGGGGSVTNQGGLSTPGGKSCYAATVQLASGETDTFGDLLIQVLDATNLLMGSINCQVVAFDPTDATALGLAALPAAAAGASGGLHVLGANAGNVSYSGNLTYSGVVALSAGLQITPGIWVHGNGAGGGNNVATVYLQGTSNNVAGLEIDGNGSGPSTFLVGGATGPGLKIGGGSTSGAAVSITNTTGDVVLVTAAAGNGNAVNLTGQGTGAGLKAILTDLATSAVNDILDAANGVETSFTLRQALRLILSALAGKLSGAATTSVTIRDVNDTKNRISATVDSSGDRTAVTYNVT